MTSCQGCVAKLPLRKKHGARGSSQKTWTCFFWGRNGFPELLQGSYYGRQSAMGLLRIRMLFHGHFGQWKSKNDPKIPDDGLSASTEYRIVLFKTSDFNHQTIQTKGTKLFWYCRKCSELLSESLNSFGFIYAFKKVQESVNTFDVPIMAPCRWNLQLADQIPIQ